MTNRETSDEISSLAAKLLATSSRHSGDHVHASEYDALLRDAKRLAGSALAQDQTPGKRVNRKHPALAAPYGNQALRDSVTCEGRENDYSNDDTPAQRLRKIAANLICYSRSKSDGDDPISEAFGFTLEAMDQYGDHVLAVVADLENPAAGTSAYEMIAAVETQNVETTETMIHMIVATMLMKGIDPDSITQAFGQPDGSYAVTISPADMDEMHRRYQMSAKREGMFTTVRIEPRADVMPSLAAEPGIDETPAEPQAEEHVYDKPLWAVRTDGVQRPVSSRLAAERVAERHSIRWPDAIIQVENVDRYDTEATSEAVDTPADEA